MWWLVFCQRKASRWNSDVGSPLRIVTIVAKRVLPKVVWGLGRKEVVFGGGGVVGNGYMKQCGGCRGLEWVRIDNGRKVVYIGDLQV